MEDIITCGVAGVFNILRKTFAREPLKPPAPSISARPKLGAESPTRGGVEPWILAFILIVFVALALWYSIATPILESYDELLHVENVLTLAVEHRLPVQTPDQVRTIPSEGGQPPLYYLLAAAVSFWTAEPGFDSQVERNNYRPHDRPFESNDNRNMYVHHLSEEFPYRGNVMAIHLMRALSALFGAGSIFITYRTAKLLFGSNPTLALGAAAFQAFIPSFVYINGMVNNDGLVICLSSLALFLMVRAVRRQSLSVRGALLLGLVIGLATLTKLSALPLLALALLAVAMIAMRTTDYKTGAVTYALLLAVFGALTAWWFVRNWTIYGSPLGPFVNDQVPGVYQAIRPLPIIVSDLQMVERSFWASFGFGFVYPDDVVLMLPRLLALFGLFGCVLCLQHARRWTQRAVVRNTVILFAAWTVLYGAGTVWWFLRTIGVTGRLLFPLLTPFVLAIVYGIYRAVPRRGAKFAVGAAGCAMLAFAVAMPITVITPAYGRPPAMAPEQVAAVEHQSDAVFGELFRLRAWSVRETNAEWHKPVHVELYWQALAKPQSEFIINMKMLSPGGVVLGDVNTLPGLGSFSVLDWTPGPIYHDRLSIYLTEELAEPGVAALSAGWFDSVAQKLLPARAGAQKVSGSVTLGRVRVAPSTPVAYFPARAVSASFAGQLELTGYDIALDALTLYWRARQRMPTDYTVFVHVLDAGGNVMAQADGQPRNGDYPTSFWLPGEVVRDEHRLRIPAGYAQIRVGLYDLQTGVRLSLLDQSADSVELQP